MPASWESANDFGRVPVIDPGESAINASCVYQKKCWPDVGFLALWILYSVENKRVFESWCRRGD